jgi:Flp pilus assembly protein TadB
VNRPCLTYAPDGVASSANRCVSGANHVAAAVIAGARPEEWAAIAAALAAATTLFLLTLPARRKRRHSPEKASGTNL